MKTYATVIEAINPHTGRLASWAGPNIPGVTETDAQGFCDTHGLGYCKVIGELVMEIEFKDMVDRSQDTVTDYETPAQN